MKKINNWIWKDFDSVTSTNDEAISFVGKLGQNCIISAKTQTNGRGRRSRIWVSEEGNLYASFAFKIELNDLSKIVILSAVATYRTIKNFISNHKIQIKWPNDILVNNEKISGILFERADDNFWIMGLGINIVSNPSLNDANYRATNLKKLGVNVTRTQVLEKFVDVFDELLAQYRNFGFEKIKKTWLDNAFNLGNAVTIKQEKQIIEGTFLTIDDNGSLILKSDNKIKKIIVGDLFTNKG